MARSSSWLRRVEIALCIMGISLLGTALGETLARRNYQVQQERALVGGPAISPEEKTPLAEIPGAAAAPAAEERSDESRRPKRPPLQVAVRSESTLDPAAFARIEIPRLGMKAVVKEGDDEETLARAVGLVRGSARPGEAGNIVLAGHRDTFFRSLRRIKVNDRIRVIVPPHTYEYEVQSTRIVAPEDTSVLGSNGVEELTLVTCYPFRFVGPAPDRFIVRAARVN